MFPLLQRVRVIYCRTIGRCRDLTNPHWLLILLLLLVTSKPNRHLTSSRFTLKAARGFGGGQPSRRRLAYPADRRWLKIDRSGLQWFIPGIALLRYATRPDNGLR